MSGTFVDAKLWNGTKLYISGDKLTYLNGKKNGLGSYLNTSTGERFEGSFIDDVLWNGTKQFASGDRVIYVNGKLSGPGSCRTSNGNWI